MVTWSHARLRRVLSAALASPISQQDLADADAALERGFTGSLSRGATYSDEAEREAAVAAAGSGGGEAGAAGSGDGGGAATPLHGAAGPLQDDPAAGAAGEDAVTADLAAAQQQIDDDLMEMVGVSRCTAGSCMLGTQAPITAGKYVHCVLVPLCRAGPTSPCLPCR